MIAMAAACTAWLQLDGIVGAPRSSLVHSTFQKPMTMDRHACKGDESNEALQAAAAEDMKLNNHGPACREPIKQNLR
jgi:hypothetical protein